MPFLTKKSTSKILLANLCYREGAGEANGRLKELLADEQFGFCAYTEKGLEPLDSVEVEHFEAGIKYNDNYYNYYAVVRWANQGKLDARFKDKPFFTDTFYRTYDGFKKRIGFANNVFYEIDPADSNARDLIDFLRLNNDELCKQRHNYVNRMKELFNDDLAKMESYFRSNRTELNFATALDAAFNSNFFDMIIAKKI
ncbi:MAG: hypothetical protein EAY75_17850 [Bacteroidetes bacterium]|nr:MAG: hypothetical protein EAY75_17850 [Bacteroidota bacterium]